MKLWLRVGVSIGLLTLLFVVLPWEELRGAVGRMSLSVWLLALLGFVLGHLLGTAKWRMLVNATRASLRPVDAIRCYAAGLFANLCLPTAVGGDVLRAGLAARATGRTEAAVLGSVADRMIDTLTMALLVAAGALFARDALPGVGSGLIAVGIVGGVLVAAAALPLLLRRPLARWPRKFRRRIGRSLVALRYLSRAGHVAVLAVLASIAVQSTFVLLSAWIGHAVGISIPLAVWFFAWPLAKLVAMLPISIGGLAVRDATLAALLVPVGVPMAVGLVASLLWQTVLITGGLIGGLVWWTLSRSRGEAAWAGLGRGQLATVPVRNRG